MASIGADEHAAESARHRALGETVRIELLRLLEASPDALDAHVLAKRLGRHVNTVRWHLAVLIDAGLVVEEETHSRRPGRPRRGYALAQPLGDEGGGYAVLAEVLVEVVAANAGGDAPALEEAGRERGRLLVRAPGERKVDAEEAVAAVVGLLRRFGFDARHEGSNGDERIAMRPCPFGEMGATRSHVVCPVHLGLMRGALDALAAPLEAVSLAPFVEPDLCVARLRRRDGADLR